MLLRIGDQLGWRVKTEWLAIEHRTAEYLWIMMFDPTGCVDQQSKTSSMGFGEPVFSKAANLHKYALSKFVVESSNSHTLDQFAFELIDHSWAPPCCHRSSQLIRLTGRESSRDHGQPHGLLLENRHPHRFAKNRCNLLGGIRWLDPCFPGRQVRMDHVSLNRPWTHNGNLDHQIVKTSRLQSREHAHLCPALDLKDSHRIGSADHVIDSRVSGRNRRESERPVEMF